MEKYFKLESKDHQKLDVKINTPEECDAIIIIVHGMAEYKERYNDFIDYLVNNHFACLSFDLRGHGASIDSLDELGFLNDQDGSKIIDDLHRIVMFVKKQIDADLPIILMSHSFGTLIARNYLQTHDANIDGLVLSGIVYNNKASQGGLLFAKFLSKIRGNHYRSNLLKNISFKPYEKPFKEKQANMWLSKNQENVAKYNEDDKCGFVFSVNGYECLMSLIKNAYKQKRYHVNNPDLPILVVAGSDDPVIGNGKQYNESVQFLKKVGYHNVRDKLYYGMRHEILNEDNHEKVYKDLLSFFNSCLK